MFLNSVSDGSSSLHSTNQQLMYYKSNANVEGFFFTAMNTQYREFSPKSAALCIYFTSLFWFSIS